MSVPVRLTSRKATTILTLRECKMSLRGETIPHPIHSTDVARLARRRLDFSAQIADMDVNSALIALIGDALHLFSNSLRVYTRPGAAINVESKSNSEGVRSTGRSATVTWRVARSRVTSAARRRLAVGACNPARRSMARTRATSTRGLKGLVT